ncbi:MAG TPA: FHA domain-containing protein [Anaeromyxobacter sp.]|nr:FHA domain-containing protein [Anaeromyxobacter sp.]
MIVEVLPPGSPEPLRPAVVGPVTLGGSQADGIAVPGLPPAAVRLFPAPAGLVLVPEEPGLKVGLRPVAPGGRRLLRAGERARFRDVALSLPAPAPAEDTRVAAAALLRGARRDPDAPSGPHLVVLTGPQAGERAAVGAGLVLGRGRGAGLRLLDAAASRRHARIEVTGAGITAEDLGAKNRLRVNGVPVERGPVLLQRGDLLTVGETEIAFEGPGVPGARAAPSGKKRGERDRADGGAGRSVGAARRDAAGARPLVAAALLAVAAVALAAVASCG